MGHSDEDPGAETQMFQAFVDGADRETDFRPSRPRAPVGLVVAGVAVVVGVVVLILLLS